MLCRVTLTSPLKTGPEIQIKKHASSLEARLAAGQLSEADFGAALAELERRESEYTRLQRHRMSVADFELLTIIGRGAFGEVGTSGVVVCSATRRSNLKKVVGLWNYFNGW